MMAINQVIPCPVCNGSIPFDTKQLLMGAKFTCPTCGAGIGLAIENKSVVEETMEKLQMLKDFSKK
ncbi:hypothetical protein AQ505_11795 [Pedobacter sp. PACM 27299]|uniref:hypothetical protein n=1 Tax=Pedobacter sp. PACM 27299 TaxID=1727164 RepID=UPI00070694DE|nr:hypothetical protein [Pedobacter sp. PACM 27299]ALL06114.1 hypothetical protein AQ505_11795 [Pedobacter sp. PACM 27299]